VNSKNGKGSGGSALSFIDSQLLAHVPQLASLVVGSADDFDRLTIYHRGPYDLLGVLKRYGSDGSVEVLFGNGPTFSAVLFALEGSYAANKWRQDKPMPRRE
jgi:hypothetical protein